MNAARASVAVALAAAVAALSAPAAPTTPRVGAYSIVLGSNCDGDVRAYWLRADGSRLTPLLPREPPLDPRAVSGNGTTISYTDEDWIYVSRADGTRLRRLVGYGGGSVALSHDGALLAFSRPNGIWIVRTDGRGLRRVTSGHDDETPDWSPDAKEFVFIRVTDGRETAVVQPLRGKARVLVHGGGSPTWSPDGRWIAFLDLGDSARHGLWIVQPNGGHRHRVARDAWAVAWSPDGRRLAFADLSGHLYVVGIDGRGLRRLPLDGARASAATWSPDGRRLAVLGSIDDEEAQIWVVGSDGRGLRRLTRACENDLIGWTRLAPVLTVVPRSERVLGAETVATRDPVNGFSADGSRVVFIAASSPTECRHLAVWTPATKSLQRVSTRRPATCAPYGEGDVEGVELAGTRVAWEWISSCGNFCYFVLASATLAQHSTATIAADVTPNDESADFGLHGHGDLLVFNDGSRLVRIGVGRERCSGGADWAPRPASVCSMLRSGAHAAPVESVSGGLIAVREPDAVAVIDAQGKLVRVFPFAPEEVSAARLDGGRLVIARAGVLEVYDPATGAGELQRPLPGGYALTDVDGGIAVLQSKDTIMLLRLADGRSFTLAPGHGPRRADLEPPGLYYSYATASGEGRVVLMLRAEVARRLDAGS